MEDLDEIIDEIDALDCSVLEEIGREDGHINNKGCFGSLIIFVGVISVMTFGITQYII